MNKKCYLVLGVILCLTLISESREIVRRTLPNEESSENEEIPLSLNPLEKGKILGHKPAILGPPTLYEDYYDNEVPVLDPVEFDEDRRILKDRDESEVEYTDSKEPEEENVVTEHEPKEGENNDEESKGVNGDEEHAPEEEENNDEERKEVKGDEEHEPEGEEKIDEERKEENGDKDNIPKEEEKLDGGRKEEEDVEDKEHIPEEVENSDEERNDEGGKEKPGSEDDDDNIHVPEEEAVDEDKKVEIPPETEEEAAEHEDDEKDEENVPQDGEEEESPSRGSIFDTPFFNLGQVKKYFGQLERALGHVFRETMDEAVMLNGTYANTTEEEVDIDGKKYIVTKSLIKGGDNNSSIYVEALSAKPKMNGTEMST